MSDEVPATTRSGEAGAMLKWREVLVLERVAGTDGMTATGQMLSGKAKTTRKHGREVVKCVLETEFSLRASIGFWASPPDAGELEGKKKSDSAFVSFGTPMTIRNGCRRALDVVRTKAYWSEQDKQLLECTKWCLQPAPKCNLRPVVNWFSTRWKREVQERKYDKGDIVRDGSHVILASLQSGLYLSAKGKVADKLVSASVFVCRRPTLAEAVELRKTDNQGASGTENLAVFSVEKKSRPSYSLEVRLPRSFPKHLICRILNFHSFSESRIVARYFAKIIMPRAVSVDESWMQVSMDGLTSFLASVLPSLQVLSLKNFSSLQNDHLLMAFGDRRRNFVLEELDLCGCINLSDEICKIIVMAGASLRCLKLATTRISDSGLQHLLAGLSCLEDLNIYGLSETVTGNGLLRAIESSTSTLARINARGTILSPDRNLLERCRSEHIKILFGPPASAPAFLHR